MTRGRVEAPVEDPGQPGALRGEGLAHQVLQEAVARHDDPALFQVPQEVPEQEDRLGGHPDQLVGPLHQRGALVGLAGPEAEQVEDSPLLGMAGLFENGRGQLGRIAIGIIAPQDMAGVLSDLVEFEGEEQGLGLEVADLEDEQHPIRQRVMAVGQGAFLGREGEEMDALVVVEAGPSVQLLELLVVQDREPVGVPGNRHGIIRAPA